MNWPTGCHRGVRARPGLGPVPDRPQLRVAHRLCRHGHRAGEQGAGQDQQPVHHLEVRLQDHRGERAEYVEYIQGGVPSTRAPWLG